MKNYKCNRKLIEFECFQCGKTETKPLSEFNRNLKLDRKNFCSRSCSVLYSNKSVFKKRKNKNFIAQFSNNALDEYSPFRYTFRNLCKRHKEIDITIEDLKEVWEQQQGVCPYTRFKLELPTYSKKVHPSIRASLDRLDSTQGYVKGNVQFVSTLANYMKSDLTHDEILAFRDALVQNFCSCYQEDQTISSPVLGVGR